MAILFENETILIDPNGSPGFETNVDLARNFQVLEVAVINNTLKFNGLREITLGIIYNNAVTTNQFSYSWEPILLGADIANVNLGVLKDIQTMSFAELIPITAKDNTQQVVLLTISDDSAADVNNFSTQNLTIDPTVGLNVGVVGVITAGATPSPAGTTYISGETAQLIGQSSGASNATATLTVSSSPGAITSPLTIVNAGSGYITGETVEVIGLTSGDTTGRSVITATHPSTNVIDTFMVNVGSLQFARDPNDKDNPLVNQGTQNIVLLSVSA